MIPTCLGKPPRSIVLVVADDLGWGDPGCFQPGSTVPTPAMDRLAREGTRFTHWRTPSALCTPSRYAMLTGRSHWRSGLPRPLVEPYGPPIIDDGAFTLPRALGSVGYQSVLVGKWHLGFRYPAVAGGTTATERDLDVHGRLTGGPLAAGFDHFYGTAGCCTSDPPYAFIDDERFTTPPTDRSQRWLNDLPGVVAGCMAPGWDITLVDDVLVDMAARFLVEHATGNGPPLFLMLALSAPHNPWVPPAGLRGASEDGDRGDMAAAFDRSLARLLSTIDAAGFADDTLLIVTSDHGPQYEEGPSGHRPVGPFRGRKNTVWEGGLRVPTVIRWPGRLAAGATSHAELHHGDLLPTLAALAGAAAEGPTLLDGMNQVPALLGTGPATRHRPVLFESGGPVHRIGAWAVLDDGWKLHVPIRANGHEGGHHLYHLPSDPGESNDVAGSNPDVGRRLRKELDASLATAGWTSLSDPGPGPRA